MKIYLKINGADYEPDAPPMKRLLDVLREDLSLTGTKEGCGEGECGACSVLINGEVVNSCLIPVCQADDTSILTVEGLAIDNRLSFLQQCFLECGGAQCGICTPGMLIAARAVLNSENDKSRASIREGIAGNLCRCTGYTKILDAIEKAVLEK
jgi:carbon-monoxide dehydrogenase small subunit